MRQTVAPGADLEFAFDENFIFPLIYSHMGILFGKELKAVHDRTQNIESFWTDQLASIKEAAEQKAKQRAAQDRAASTQQPLPKEQSHGR